MDKNVSDLGAAAYVLMHGYNVKGRRGQNFFFEVKNAEDASEFDRLTLKYLNSEFHRFDSCLMSLKKIPESC